MTSRTTAINTLRYDPELCTGCGMCTVVCPHRVFAIDGRVARLVRPEACMECGACQLNCPVEAIVVDSGVGCAAAMIRAALLGQKEATCGPAAGTSCCSAEGSGQVSCSESSSCLRGRMGSQRGERKETKMSIKRMTVGEIVEGRPTYFVVETDTALEAARYMSEYQIGAVPVLEDGYEPGVFVNQVGIFSERDLMTRVVAEGLNAAQTEVGEVMTEEVAVIGPETTCREALVIMDRLHIRHVPVLAGRQLLGTVSIRDLQQAEADAKEEEINFLDDYIDTMDEAVWGLIPVEEVCSRVVMQKARRARRSEHGGQA